MSRAGLSGSTAPRRPPGEILAAQSITGAGRARLRDRCNTSPNLLFIRVPLPVAITTTSTGVAMGVAVDFLHSGVRLKALELLRLISLPCLSRLAACWRPGLRLAGVLAAALLLPACGVIKTAYNQAPELAYWYLDAYADFTGAQTLQVKAELTGLHAWHRRTQLPGYIELLQDAQRQVRGDINPTQACAILADMRRKWRAINEQAEPSVALLAASLDAGQLQHIERRFAKGNAEYREDFFETTPEAVRARRLKKAISRAEMLYGRLGDSQTALLGRMIDQSGFDAARAYAERLRRQQDALQTLRQLTSSPSAGRAASPAGDNVEKTDQSAQVVSGLMDRTLNSPDAPYRDYDEQLTADSCKSFAEFHNATSAAQRSKAAATLNNYETDLKALAGQSSH